MDPSEATQAQTPINDVSLAKRRTRRSSPSWRASEYEPRTYVDQQKIDLETLREHFHLPIVEAAKYLGVCTTILKKICRKHGIPRWPYRKLASLDKHIAHLKEAANHQDPLQETNVQEKLVAAQMDKEAVIAIQYWKKPRKTVKSRRHDRFPYRDVIEPFDEELAASLRPRSNRHSKRQADSDTNYIAKPPRVSHLSLLQQPLHPNPLQIDAPSNDTSNQLWTVPMTMPQLANPPYGWVGPTEPSAPSFSSYAFQLPNPWALQPIPAVTDESHYQQMPFVAPPSQLNNTSYPSYGFAMDPSKSHGR